MSTKVAPNLTLKDPYYRQLLFVPYAKMYFALKAGGAPLLAYLPDFANYVSNYASGDAYNALTLLTNTFNSEIANLYAKLPVGFKVDSGVGTSYQDFKSKVLQTPIVKLSAAGRSKKGKSKPNVRIGLHPFSNLPRPIIPGNILQSNIMQMQSPQMQSVPQITISNNVSSIYRGTITSKHLFIIAS